MAKHKVTLETYNEEDHYVPEEMEVPTVALYKLWFVSISGSLWAFFDHVLLAPLHSLLCSITVNGTQAMSWSEDLSGQVHSHMT